MESKAGLSKNGVPFLRKAPIWPEWPFSTQRHLKIRAAQQFAREEKSTEQLQQRAQEDKVKQKKQKEARKKREAEKAWSVANEIERERQQMIVMKQMENRRLAARKEAAQRYPRHVDQKEFNRHIKPFTLLQAGGEVSDAEAVAALKFINANFDLDNPEHKRRWDAMLQVWYKSEVKRVGDEEDAERALMAHEERIQHLKMKAAKAEVELAKQTLERETDAATLALEQAQMEDEILRQAEYDREAELAKAAAVQVAKERQIALEQAVEEAQTLADEAELERLRTAKAQMEAEDRERERRRLAELAAARDRAQRDAQTKRDTQAQRDVQAAAELAQLEEARDKARLAVKAAERLARVQRDTKSMQAEADRLREANRLADQRRQPKSPEEPVRLNHRSQIPEPKPERPPSARRSKPETADYPSTYKSEGDGLEGLHATEPDVFADGPRDVASQLAAKKLEDDMISADQRRLNALDRDDFLEDLRARAALRLQEERREAKRAAYESEKEAYAAAARAAMDPAALRRLECDEDLKKHDLKSIERAAMEAEFTAKQAAREKEDKKQLADADQLAAEHRLRHAPQLAYEKRKREKKEAAEKVKKAEEDATIERVRENLIRVESEAGQQRREAEKARHQRMEQDARGRDSRENAARHPAGKNSKRAAQPIVETIPRSRKQEKNASVTETTNGGTTKAKVPVKQVPKSQTKNVEDHQDVPERTAVQKMMDQETAAGKAKSAARYNTLEGKIAAQKEIEDKRLIEKQRQATEAAKAEREAVAERVAKRYREDMEYLAKADPAAWLKDKASYLVVRTPKPRPSGGHGPLQQPPDWHEELKWIEITHDPNAPGDENKALKYYKRRWEARQIAWLQQEGRHGTQEDIYTQTDKLLRDPTIIDKPMGSTSITLRDYLEMHEKEGFDIKPRGRVTEVL